MIDRDWERFESSLTIIGDEAYLPGEPIEEAHDVGRPPIHGLYSLGADHAAQLALRRQQYAESAEAQQKARRRAANRDYMRRKRASDPAYREREKVMQREYRRRVRPSQMTDDDLMAAIEQHEDALARLVMERSRRARISERVLLEPEQQ